MNALTGKITQISTDGKLSIAHVLVNDVVMSAIIIDTPETLDYLKLGQEVQVIFKETEVILGIGNQEGISLRNKLPGVINKIQKGVLLSKVVIDTSAGLVTSIITSNAVGQLALDVGSKVTAMIKTNEIMLSQ